jgi:hypothetical protein
MSAFMDVDSFVSYVVDYFLARVGAAMSKQETAACLLRLAVARLRACGETDDSIETLFDAIAYGEPVDVARAVADMIGGHVALMVVPGPARLSAATGPARSAE